MMHHNNTRIPRNKIVTVNNIERTYEELKKEANCISELRKEEHKQHFDVEGKPRMGVYNGIMNGIDNIEGDIIKHGRLLEYLKNNHKQFKQDLGAKQFNDDNIDFKKQILKTHDDLKFYKNKLLKIFNM